MFVEMGIHWLEAYAQNSEAMKTAWTEVAMAQQSAVVRI